jgi:hypothetical protein
VFLNSHRYKTPENAIKQNISRGKTDIETFVEILEKVFGTVDKGGGSGRQLAGTSCQNIFMAFLNSELPLPRNAQKRTKTKSQKK